MTKFDDVVAVIVVQNNIVNELYLFDADIEGAEAKFGELCSKYISYWDNWDIDYINETIDLGYIGFEDETGSISIINPII